jgi:hypothetical protein
MAVVMVATPHGGKVNPEFYRWLLAMQGQWLQHQFIHGEVDLMIIGKARNMVTELFLQQPNVDVIWFIDDDVLVPLHAGQLIDQAVQLGVVSGVYFARRPPYTPQIYRAAHEPGLEGKYWPIIDYPKSGMMVVDAVGGGCLAVRRDVLLSMQANLNNRKAQALSTLNEVLVRQQDKAALDFLLTYLRSLSPWFEFLDQKGEDLYFCERARDAGYVIWVNVDVKCLHIAEVSIEETFFLSLKEQGLIKFAPGSAPGAVIAAVMGPAEQVATPQQVPGGAGDENPVSFFTGSEAVERNNNLPRASRRIGISGGLS